MTPITSPLDLHARINTLPNHQQNEIRSLLTNGHINTAISRLERYCPDPVPANLNQQETAASP